MLACIAIEDSAFHSISFVVKTKPETAQVPKLCALTANKSETRCTGDVKYAT